MNSRLSNYEDCQDAINALFQSAVASEASSAFMQFLDFAVRFSNLSMYNAMLVRVQYPGATAVASARKWATIGRYLKPDATPLVILQPFGPVAFVYELDDTDGSEIDGADANSLFATGTVRNEIMDSCEVNANDQGVSVTLAPFGKIMAGFAQPGHEMSATEVTAVGSKRRWNVVVNSNLDQPSRFATLAHELGHVYCGHVGGHPDGRWADRKGLPYEVCELEAEAVAWLVSQRNGVSPRSAEYLSDLASPENLTQVSMFAIYDAANRIEARSSSLKKKSVRQKTVSQPGGLLEPGKGSFEATPRQP